MHNIGDIVLWCKTRVGVVRASPGLPTIKVVTEEYQGGLQDYLYIPAWVDQVLGFVIPGEDIRESLRRGRNIVDTRASLAETPTVTLVTSKCFNHQWKEYVGFTDRFNYCEVPGCGVKQQQRG